MAEVEKLKKETDVKMHAALESIKKHFSNIRTSRAHPSLVEDIKVDYYGTMMILKQLANISAADARMLVIQPWDKGAIAAIEKGILASDLGVTPVIDGNAIRISLPPLTQDRRNELAKVLGKIAEEGRVSVRNTRHESNDKTTSLEKDKLISEDDKFHLKDEVQKMTDKYIKLIDEELKKKQQEVTQ
ncbi:MAG: ribosome recycling factor [Candidatus Omnitrophica bacterium]|nr:ribosome recycling factor [Candidatus Omnitrophota bacterium]